MELTLNENFFGLDISDRSLKLVQLKKIGKNIILNSHNSLAIPPDIIVNGEIKNEQKLIELVKELVKSTKGSKIKTKKVISVLPETKTFIKVITVKSPKGKKRKDKEELADLIKEEIKNHIPLDPEEIYLDWQILNQTAAEVKLLLGAVPKEISNSYYTVLEKSGLDPTVLEIEAAAIIRSLIATAEQKARIIIDFGAIRTGLIVYDQETVQFTVSLPISGRKITETISNTLKIDLKKAEKSKIVCGLDPEKCEGALLKVLMKPINDLASNIKKATGYYQANFPKAGKISEIFLCGGGANFAKIDEVLSVKIGLPVTIGNPFTKLKRTKKTSIPKNITLSYTTAIGLALRPFEKNN